MEDRGGFWWKGKVVVTNNENGLDVNKPKNGRHYG
jgi:hypothetical protein